MFTCFSSELPWLCQLLFGVTLVSFHLLRSADREVVFDLVLGGPGRPRDSALAGRVGPVMSTWLARPSRVVWASLAIVADLLGNWPGVLLGRCPELTAGLPWLRQHRRRRIQRRVSAGGPRLPPDAAASHQALEELVGHFHRQEK